MHGHVNGGVCFIVLLCFYINVRKCVYTFQSTLHETICIYGTPV